MFGIKLNTNIETYFDENNYFGYISINDFHEKFFFPIGFWTKEEYF
jgi:hypothetical protein